MNISVVVTYIYSKIAIRVANSNLMPFGWLAQLVKAIYITYLWFLVSSHHNMYIAYYIFLNVCFTLISSLASTL
jgi:hypothetical protein